MFYIPLFINWSLFSLLSLLNDAKPRKLKLMNEMLQQNTFCLILGDTNTLRITFSQFHVIQRIIVNWGPFMISCYNCQVFIWRGYSLAFLYRRADDIFFVPSYFGIIMSVDVVQKATNCSLTLKQPLWCYILFLSKENNKCVVKGLGHCLSVNEF